MTTEYHDVRLTLADGSTHVVKTVGSGAFSVLSAALSGASMDGLIGCGDMLVEVAFDDERFLVEMFGDRSRLSAMLADYGLRLVESS